VAVNVGQIFCGDCAHGLIFTQRREVRKELFNRNAINENKIRFSLA
jgi:hypothetical protein